ncbi:acyl-CoA thioesterase [Spirochaeta cellobiosiphila]|uniref:acyl-CoA thioesterase n=1 Tax=Spirochaeta cellobiosiphila TaxID=504483 RepID=UPI000419707E|nr:thioesterase family protein [Spirochaeta cellobiosiphila]
MSKLVVIKPISIKGYDIDVMGIVSNVHYVRWFEDIRQVFLDENYPFSRMINENIAPILMKTEIEYKRPLTIHDKPVGKGIVTKMERMKWEFKFQIYTESHIHCIGTQVGAFWDLSKERPTPIPDKLRQLYTEEIELMTNI